MLAGEIEGRRSAEEITVYKSLGHVVQDLASAWALYSQAEGPVLKNIPAPCNAYCSGGTSTVVL